MKTLLFVPALFVAAALPFGGAPVADPLAHTAPLGEHDWQIDDVHSSVVFRVKHAGAAWFHGTFDKIAGSITLDPAAPEKGRIELTIPVDSVDTNNQKRDEHLRSGDFFGAKENPDITFRSSKIEKKGDVLHVTGELAMAGKKQQVTIPVRMTGEGEFHGKRKGWMAEFPIQRSDFGMTYGLDGNALGDEVTLMIAIEGVEAK